MTFERERKMEPVAVVTVTFKQSTLDKIGEAARLLGLDVVLYVGVAATSAACEDLMRRDRRLLAKEGKMLHVRGGRRRSDKVDGEVRKEA